MVAAQEGLARIGAQLLEQVLATYRKSDFRVRLWDGSTWGGDEQPRFALLVNHSAGLRAMFVEPGELSMGEAYIRGDLDIEGDINAAFDFVDHLLLLGKEHAAQDPSMLADLLRLLPAVEETPSHTRPANLGGTLHSRDRDWRAISYHYDYPAEFYSLWLDGHMVYSCAYFANSEEDLDSAQERKLDYICRKLRLRPGDRLLDIGCGWGGLIMHAAAHYRVQAVGITISVPQAELARERIRQSGLNDRCRVEVCDYRDVESDRPYDKIASIGMFEHVGEALLPEYFSRVWELLQPGGLFLNHGIAYSATYQRRCSSFIDNYVFPDGELVPISTTLRAAEMSGFEVRDLESLREHYPLTLGHWVRRLEAHSDEARRITDEATYRLWRIYMSGSAHAFKTGRLNVYQALMSKCPGGSSALPLTREHLCVLHS
jgi:cyclopropane-fatty-acyl-phospholipid synthase